jgi:hypothetical protein
MQKEMGSLLHEISVMPLLPPISWPNCREAPVIHELFCKYIVLNANGSNPLEPGIQKSLYLMSGTNLIMIQLELLA